jgi:hydroxypyruvate isomerase
VFRLPVAARRNRARGRHALMTGCWLVARRCRGPEVTMLFAPNLSMLWADLPLADRFERAARAGFGAVELWWPGATAAASLPGLTSRWELRLALLNFDAGDMAAGDRGLAADPRRREQLRANVPAALQIARSCGCERRNLLIGLRQRRYSLGQQLACARDNVAWAADLAAEAGWMTTGDRPAASHELISQRRHNPESRRQ